MREIYKMLALIFSVFIPSLCPGLEVSKFSFNDDGCDKTISKTYCKNTASGICNGGEILGYTIPLDKSLRRIKRIDGKPVARLFQAAILTFTDGDNVYKLLVIGNDTGGRHIKGNRYNRDFGELGINTYRALIKLGVKIKLGYHYLVVPKGFRLHYEFLEREVRTVKEYQSLKEQLEFQNRL